MTSDTRLCDVAHRFVYELRKARQDGKMPGLQPVVLNVPIPGNVVPVARIAERRLLVVVGESQQEVGKVALAPSASDLPALLRFEGRYVSEVRLYFEPRVLEWQRISMVLSRVNFLDSH